MSVPFDLRIDLGSGEPVISTDDLALGSVPQFVEGVNIDFRLWAVTKTAGVASYLPVSGITVFMALGNLVSNPPTYYTQQASWTASGDGSPYFSGTLPMNVAFGFAAGQRSITADFGVYFFSGATPIGALLKSVKVKKSLYSTASLIVPVGQTPLSVEGADARYLQRTIIGPIILVNETDQTKRNMIYTDTDGSFKASPV